METFEMEQTRARVGSWVMVRAWWKRKPINEQCLIYILILLAIGAVSIMIIGIEAVNKQRLTIMKLREKCQTEICIQEAASMLGRMNTSIDPCDDFYEYACGRFIEETLIPEDKSLIYPAGVIEDLVELQVQNMISEPSLPTDIEPYVMLRKMYAACMDTNAIEKSGLSQMKLLLKKLGGWPILENYSWEELDWTNVTQRLRQYGFATNQFMGIDAEVNLNGSNEYIIYIHQWKHDEIASMILGDVYNLYGKKYTEFLVEIAELFGAQPEFAKREVDAVIKFRERLSNALEGVVEPKKSWINATITTIENIQVQYPTIPWIDVLNYALQIPNTTLSKQTRVAVTAPTYISEFATIIKETPKRVQVNHALFQIIRSRINCLPTVIWETEEQLFFNMTNIKRMRPVRWRTCLNMVTDHFGIAIDSLYIRKYRHDNTKEDVTQMMVNIKEVFTNRLKKVDWMDNGTKAKAIEKTETMIANIAYPYEFNQESNIADFYKGLTIGTNNNVLALVTQMSKFNKDKQLSHYSKTVIKNYWTSQVRAITSNAFYDVFQNILNIPMGILQNEFYRFGGSKFKNYGGLGFVLAHEITHGFDSHGRSFNSMGEVMDWWNAGVKDKYDMKAQCFVDQYNKYAVPGTNLSVNGKSTLPENIADNSGVKDAYLAYLAWREEHGPGHTLPGIDLTDKQLFWVSYANAWCAKHKLDSLKYMVLGGINPPFRFKILGSLSNTEYFSEDFNCPLGSKMNPIKKCQVW